MKKTVILLAFCVSMLTLLCSCATPRYVAPTKIPGYRQFVRTQKKTGRSPSLEIRTIFIGQTDVDVTLRLDPRTEPREAVEMMIAVALFLTTVEAFEYVAGMRIESASNLDGYGRLGFYSIKAQTNEYEFSSHISYSDEHGLYFSIYARKKRYLDSDPRLSQFFELRLADSQIIHHDTGQPFSVDEFIIFR